MDFANLQIDFTNLKMDITNLEMDSTNLNMEGLDLQQATVRPAGGVGEHSLHLRLHH
jgi:hypothetical protein